MGIFCDCTSSILLCPEDNNSILGVDDDDDDNVDEQQCIKAKRQHFGQVLDQNSVFYEVMLLNGFSLESDEYITLLVDRESNYMPKNDYVERLQTGTLDQAVRVDAIDWIYKVHTHYKLGPVSAYLSVNYLDRFLSVTEIPQGKTWVAQLLSVACLSLAVKMDETEVLLSQDLQVSAAKYVFETRTIQRMELLVLSTLKWRMHSVNPFSFIVFFLQKFGDEKCRQLSLLSGSVELILNTIRGIEFLEFRPSEIAAAVALVALKVNKSLISNKVMSCYYVDKETVIRCYEVIQKEAPMKKWIPQKTSVVSYVPQSPIGVLDTACISFSSVDTEDALLENSHQTSPADKRRKTLDAPLQSHKL